MEPTKIINSVVNVTVYIKDGEEYISETFYINGDIVYTMINCALATQRN